MPNQFTLDAAMPPAGILPSQLHDEINEYDRAAKQQPRVTAEFWNFHRPLTDYQVIIETIAATTTQTGLTVQAVLDQREYPTGSRSPTRR